VGEQEAAYLCNLRREQSRRLVLSPASEGIRETRGQAHGWHAGSFQINRSGCEQAQLPLLALRDILRRRGISVAYEA
jgi:hypothetical protein